MGKLFDSSECRRRILYWLVKGTEIPADERETHVHFLDIKDISIDNIPSEAELAEVARIYWASQPD